MKTFQCQFNKEVSCTVQTTDEAPTKNEPHILNVEWKGKVSQRLLRPYIAWMNSVNKTLADEWGKKLMHVFQVSQVWDDAEIWVYTPNQPPKRVRD